ncbi:MAG: DUF1080 domain-containing protein [Planctomycetota bacterium]
MSQQSSSLLNRVVAGVVACVFVLGLGGAARGAQPALKVYTDPQQVDNDYKFQGEYVGEIAQPDGTKTKFGAQVRALGDGNFRTAFFGGGLPGDGWDGKTVIQKAPSTDSAIPTDSKLDGDKVVIEQVYKGTLDGKVLTGQTDTGVKFELQRVDRQSPTLGAKPPDGALVLFDGTNTDQWQKGAVLTPQKLLGPGPTTVRKFQDFTLHVEFMISYVPHTQNINQRPNSGVYLQQHYEIQILDSFGVTMGVHDCGVLYAQTKLTLNMCYPPLTWQTYDIDFTAARYDEAGKKTKLAKVTVKFNGVLIIDNVEILHSTPGGTPETPEPSGIYLQLHGLPVFFKNVWLVEKK